MSGWADLPGDIISRIEKLLLLYNDKVRFSCTSKFCRSVLPNLPNLHQLQHPWLFAPIDGVSSASHQFFDPSEKKTYFLVLDKFPAGKVFKGSSHGWVATVEDNDSMYLINPLTAAQIQLPPRSKFPDVKGYNAGESEPYLLWNSTGIEAVSCDSVYIRNCYMSKIILSSSPSLNDDYVAVAIYGQSRKLAFCKGGDDRWTALGNKKSYVDIIFYKGQLYALGNRGELWLCKMKQKEIEITKNISMEQPGVAFAENLYLVESSFGHLMVARYIDESYFDDNNVGHKKTSSFEVFVFEFSRSCWRKVTNIGDDALFLGYNSSTSCNFPPIRNKIYFSDDHIILDEDKSRAGTGLDMGVFDLESGRIEKFSGFQCHTNFLFPGPIWFTPRF